MPSSSLSNRPLTERELKALCLERLWSSKRISPSCVIASEFPLTEVAVRIDLAIATKTLLIGVEIKSELDSLRRLTKQVEEFSNFFDYLIVVLAGKHSATNYDFPHNVEVWRYCDRGLKKEPAKARKKQSESLAKLLPRRKRLRLQQEAGRPRAARDSFMYEFRRRYQMTSKSFWGHVAISGLITPDDLKILSPYHNLRKASAERKAQKLDLLKGWQNDYSDQASSVS